MNADRGQIAALGIVVVALLIFAVAGSYILTAAYDEAADRRVDVENETFVPGSGGLVTLDESNNRSVIYDSPSEVAVYDENGTLMSQPDDYVWNTNNGTLTVNASGDLAGDTSANASYGLSVGSEQARGVLQLTAVQTTVFKVLVLVVVVALVLTGLRVLGRS